MSDSSQLVRIQAPQSTRRRVVVIPRASLPRVDALEDHLERHARESAGDD